MKLRNRIVLLMALSMIVPAVAQGLPRPEGARQIEPETLVASYQVPAVGASAAFGVSTPVLTKGRSYRIEIQGTWIWDKNESGRFADAAYTTFDSWSSKSKAGRGLQVGTQNLGSPDNLAVGNWSPDSTYSVEYQGRGISELIRIVDGNYDDNAHTSAYANGLIVKIFQVAKVTWVAAVSVEVGQDLVIPGTPVIAVDTWPLVQTMTVIPNIDTPLIQIPKTDLPFIASVTYDGTSTEGCSQGAHQNRIIVNVLGVQAANQNLGCSALGDKRKDEGRIGGETGPVTIVEERRNCVARAGKSPATQDYYLSTMTATEECKQQVPPGIRFPLLQDRGETRIQGCRPGQVGFCNPIPPGSSLSFVFKWQADRTYLYQVPFSDDQFGAFLPFDPKGRTNDGLMTQAEWYFANRDRLAASMATLIIGPGGQVLYESPPVIIPGLGQVLEAAFETRVAGQ